MPGEVLPSREFYSYESKYVDGTSGLLIPAPLPAETADKDPPDGRAGLYQPSTAPAWRGWISSSKKPPARFYLNEVNTIPGFTNISMYPKLWEATGLALRQTG